MNLYLVGHEGFCGLDHTELALARSAADARRRYREMVYEKGRNVPDRIVARELPLDAPRILDTYNEEWQLTVRELHEEQGIHHEQVAWWAT